MIFVFADTKYGTTFKVSLKVMFSFFRDYPDSRFRLLKEIEVGHVDYLISRNPYERAVSLFFDKLRGRMIALERPECEQIELMRHLHLTDLVELGSISFDDFCAALPTIWERNWHFIPQTFGVDLSVVRNIVDMHELSELSEKLDIDFSRKANTSEHGEWRTYYTKLSMFAIQNVYHRDFELLGYSTV